MSRARLVLCVLVPFAAGYYLLPPVPLHQCAHRRRPPGRAWSESRRFRGALTSAYFLVFAAVLLPCGVLLDRYGPRLVDSALLLVAAVGSLVFACADGVWTSLTPRPRADRPRRCRRIDGRPQGDRPVVPAAPHRARQRLVHHAGCARRLVGDRSCRRLRSERRMAWPVRHSRCRVGSRGASHSPHRTRAGQVRTVGSAAIPSIGFLAIFRDPRFRRLAPLSATGVGVSWSLQELWAAQWLTEVAGLDRSAVVEHLTLMAAVLAANALLLGALTERLRRAGVSTELFLVGTLALSMAAQVALLFGVPVSSYLLFAVIAAAGATTVLSFALLARYFPKEAAGRANAALAFSTWAPRSVCRRLSGLIIAQWPADGGHYPAQAHQAALAAGLALQLVRPVRLPRAQAPRPADADGSCRRKSAGRRFTHRRRHAGALRGRPLGVATARRTHTPTGNSVALRRRRFHGAMSWLGRFVLALSAPGHRASPRPGERAAHGCG